ncbi:MAG: hypothetical protein AAF914_09825 [Pseudomonadota bacterium]
MLHAVTCLFNPSSYASRADNYWTFRERLDCPLTTIELSFTGHFSVPDAIHVHGGPDHLMWQKERLLNIAIAALPPDVDRVAWIDADLIFRASDWVHRADALLDRYPVVQLFDRIVMLDAAGQPVAARRSFGATRGAFYGAPGGAWAAQRRVVSAGLLDFDILGGGDYLAALAWCQRWKPNHLSSYPKPMIRAFLAWAKSQQPLVGGQVGCVPGDVFHLYHGKVENRRYQTRSEILMAADFDPHIDIAKDSAGIWRWASDKPALRVEVKRYFDGRREDDI